MAAKAVDAAKASANSYALVSGQYPERRPRAASPPQRIAMPAPPSQVAGGHPRVQAATATRKQAPAASGTRTPLVITAFIRGSLFRFHRLPCTHQASALDLAGQAIETGKGTPFLGADHLRARTLDS